MKVLTKFFSKKENTADINPENESREKIHNINTVLQKYDKKHIWAFTSGHSSNDFRGNPKFLFIYITRYRPDIFAYWICSNEELKNDVEIIDNANAFYLQSEECQTLLSKTGVFVGEQVKASIPENCFDFTYLNLWHGIGYKTVERLLSEGHLSRMLAKKYIKYNDFYKSNQLMLTGSESNIIRESTCLGLTDSNFVKAGYPRCIYQKAFEPVETFPHNLKEQKGLSDSAKIVVYAPTHRKSDEPFFYKAIPDLEKLYEKCVKNDYLFVFKVHPYLEDDNSFNRFKVKYQNYDRFLFWDNRNDFYEVLKDTDLLIYDYSSIFSDCIAADVSHYIRYVFDYDEYFDSGLAVEEYYLESTAGDFVYDYESLLDALDDYESTCCLSDVERLKEQLWGFSNGKSDFDKIIEAALDFEPLKITKRNLYSFDVFDTLFTRKTLDPKGVFFYVKNQMEKDGTFPKDLTDYYPKIRNEAEGNMRVCKRILSEIDRSENVEICFDDIFDRIKELYNLSEEQIGLLKQWELDSELDNVIPLYDQIDKVKQLLSQDEKVVLISDMYLPKAFIKTLLEKADPVLKDLPLFLSNEYGVHKASGDLFLKVYNSFEPYYDFTEWIHYGDNQNADINQARKLNITAKKVYNPNFNEFESQLAESLDSYDGYLLAALQARLRDKYPNNINSFVIDFVALFLVPYIDWVLKHALDKGYRYLYFVSRDGFHLKRITDAIIESTGIDIETKYIYASRNTWRVPSFIDSIDEMHWQKNGNFERVDSKESFLDALFLSEEEFNSLFPTIDLDSFDFSLNDIVDSDIISVIKQSKDYTNHLLRIAKEQRDSVFDYFDQEINSKEDFAFVDYYGSGYTQNCLTRLWRAYTNDNSAVIPFYYSRSLRLNEDGVIRYNFTSGPAAPHVMMESVFSNMPYKTIRGYKKNNGVIYPVIEKQPYNYQMFYALFTILPDFAKNYSGIDFITKGAFNRSVISTIQSYYKNNHSDEMIMNNVAPLKDSPTLYGKMNEFAPPLTKDNFEDIINNNSNTVFFTHSLEMSLERSDEETKNLFNNMYQVLPGDPKGHFGKRLKPNQLERSNKIQRKYFKLRQKASLIKDYYDEFVQETEVTDSIVFVVNGFGNKERGLYRLKDYLSSRLSCSIELIVMNRLSSDIELKQACRKIAESRFVIVDTPVDYLCEVQFRAETKEMLIPASGFNLYRKGVGAKYTLRWKDKYNSYSKKNDFAVIQVPSKNQIDNYVNMYTYNNRIRDVIPGCCNTDYYFNHTKEECRKLVNDVFPESKGKQIILFAPSLRPIDDWEDWARFLDISVLEKYLSDEYVVIVNCNSKGSTYINLFDIPGFSKTINDEIPVKALALASDIIVSDYRDVMFESTLLDKPLFSFAYDHEKKLRAKNLNINDFSEIDFCPIIKTSYDLINHIKQIDNYDYTKINQFRELNYGDCKGQSMENVLKYIKKHLTKR